MKRRARRTPSPVAELARSWARLRRMFRGERGEPRRRPWMAPWPARFGRSNDGRRTPSTDD